ncbi:hypothetical protein Tco_0591129 [Tanacetum coccineum]
MKFMNRGSKMEYRMKCVIIFVNLSVLRTGKLNSPPAIQMKMDSVMLQDYWLKVNDHERSPFTNWRDHICGPYANYYSNVHNEEEQEDEERRKLFQESPICKIRRFEMIKYSFGQEEEYFAIKKNKYDDLTRANEEACHAYQEIFRNMDEGWLVTRAE